MSGYQSVFRRVEVKFLLSAAQYWALVPVLERYMALTATGQHVVELLEIQGIPEA